MTKILAFAGSARTDSLNKRLVHVAAESARDAGGDVTVVDLRDFAMPLYDGDLEAAEGVPENATRLREAMTEHQALLLSCPEYNSSITPVLKNAIDWVSRPAEGAPPLVAFKGKVAALLSASPGALGGLRGLTHVRSILGNIGVLVLPDQVAIPKAHEAFSDDGALVDERVGAKVTALARQLVETASRLGG